MNEQKINVCRAIAAMFAQREDVTDEEMAFVGQAALHLGLDEGELKAVQQALATPLDFAKLIASVTDPMLRRFLFGRIVAAALTDDHLSERERSLVDKTATAFGWDKSAVNQYVECQQKAIEWDRKAQDVLAKLR
jgi:uncharacterized membrane protein YebE (DUF533 family)